MATPSTAVSPTADSPTTATRSKLGIALRVIATLVMVGTPILALFVVSSLLLQWDAPVWLAASLPVVLVLVLPLTWHGLAERRRRRRGKAPGMLTGYDRLKLRGAAVLAVVLGGPLVLAWSGTISAVERHGDWPIALASGELAIDDRGGDRIRGSLPLEWLARAPKDSRMILMIHRGDDDGSPASRVKGAMQGFAGPILAKASGSGNGSMQMVLWAMGGDGKDKGSMVVLAGDVAQWREKAREKGGVEDEFDGREMWRAPEDAIAEVWDDETVVARTGTWATQYLAGEDEKSGEQPAESEPGGETTGDPAAADDPALDPELADALSRLPRGSLVVVISRNFQLSKEDLLRNAAAAMHFTREEVILSASLRARDPARVAEAHALVAKRLILMMSLMPSQENDAGKSRNQLLLERMKVDITGDLVHLETRLTMDEFFSFSTRSR